MCVYIWGLQNPDVFILGSMGNGEKKMVHGHKGTCNWNNE